MALPAPVTALLDALLDVDMMSRKIEDEAVTEVPENLIGALAKALRSHQADPGVVGILLNAIGKLAAHADNHDAVDHAGTVQLVTFRPP